MSPSLKKCKGCSAPVANPVTCPGCKVISHPGPSCLTRTGHPCTDNGLTDCRKGSSTSRTAVNQPIVSSDQSLTVIPTASLQSISALPSADKIKDIVGDLIDSRLAAFKEDILSCIRAELGVLRSDINSLSERVLALEENPVITAAQLPAPTVDDIIVEMKERELRSKNVIIFGIPEPRESSPEISRSAEVNAARGVLAEICLLVAQDLAVHRLGKPGKTPCRPLCVRLDSAAEVKRILQSKHRYKGPYKISDDKTTQQRGTLTLLREKLRDLQETGETHMTIRYNRGVPRIVAGRPRNDTSQKN